jgi:hypothetical protein
MERQGRAKRDLRSKNEKWHGEMTRLKIRIKSRDKAERESGRKEARNLFMGHRDGIQRLQRLRGNDD